MGKRKSAADWKAFLAALRRSGNVRLAAAEAGMDVGTAYDRKIKDPKFAARFEAALANGKAAAAKARAPAGNGKLVVRKTKHGTQLIQVGPGRWSPEAEETCLAALAHTGCVSAAARACGFSTNTLYYRRKHYPDFAERWAAAEALAAERLPGLLVAAGIAALDPEIAEEEGAKLPPVNVDQAIRIVRMKGNGAAGGARPGRNIPPEPSIEEVRDEIVRRIAAIRRHREESGDDRSTGPADDCPPGADE